MSATPYWIIIAGFAVVALCAAPAIGWGIFVPVMMWFCAILYAQLTGLLK